MYKLILTPLMVASLALATIAEAKGKGSHSGKGKQGHKSHGGKHKGK